MKQISRKIAKLWLLGRIEYCIGYCGDSKEQAIEGLRSELKILRICPCCADYAPIDWPWGFCGNCRPNLSEKSLPKYVEVKTTKPCKVCGVAVPSNWPFDEWCNNCILTDEELESINAKDAIAFYERMRDTEDPDNVAKFNYKLIDQLRSDKNVIEEKT